SDLGGARQRQGKRRLDVRVAIDLAADVTDQPTLARAQDAQFSTVADELFGVGVAPRHHRRAFGDAEVGLPHPVSLSETQSGWQVESNWVMLLVDERCLQPDLVGADRIVPVASVAASRDIDASSSPQAAGT